MLQRYCLAGAVGLALMLVLLGSATGVEDACRWDAPDLPEVTMPETAAESGDRDTYTGTIRVYVTEMDGRWDDSDDSAFHNCFLAFALQEDISLETADTLRWNLQWDGHDYFDAGGSSYSDLQEDNVKVIAAVFNSAGYTGYSDPPSGAPFVVHEVDATAGATSGTTGSNEEIGDFTHSVFVEDGSTTW